MSRTYRRVKPKRSNNDCYLGSEQDWYYSPEKDYDPVAKETPGFKKYTTYGLECVQNNKLWKKQYNKEHKDSDRGIYSPPSWFVNVYHNRPARRHDKAEIKRYLRNEEYEPLFSRYRKSAGRDWW